MATLYEAVLGDRLTALGFQLEGDEDFAYLSLNGRLVQVFNAKTVTVKELRDRAANIWQGMASQSKQV